MFYFSTHIIFKHFQRWKTSKQVCNFDSLLSSNDNGKALANSLPVCSSTFLFHIAKFFFKKTAATMVMNCKDCLMILLKPLEIRSKHQSILSGHETSIVDAASLNAEQLFPARLTFTAEQFICFTGHCLFLVDIIWKICFCDNKKNG